MNKFKLYPALITPFTGDNLIDFEALRKMVKKLLAEECDGLVVLGTTAEAASLSSEERVILLRFLRHLIPVTIPMITGVGTNNLEETMRNIQVADAAGVDGVLIVTPYYVCPSQKGLFAYFEELARICPLPIYLYNVKRRCGVELEPSTVEELLVKCSNIKGLKQAGGNYEKYLYLKDRFERFELFSGDDNLFLEAVEMKLDGLISVIGNAKLGFMKELLQERTKENTGWWEEMCVDFYAEPTPAPVKYAVSKQGIGSAKLRLPLCGVSEALKEKLDRYL